MGEKAASASVDGMRLLADVALLELSLSATPSTEMVLTYAGTGGYTLTGTFFQDSYSEAIAYNDAVTFSSSFS